MATVQPELWLWALITTTNNNNPNTEFMQGRTWVEKSVSQ
jgi:hypothetical protein